MAKSGSTGKRLKIGVVGCGGIASESHLPVLTSIRSAEVVALCDKESSAAQAAASRYGVDSIYPDVSEMISKENLDVVDICAPPYTHAPLATEAMEAGCNVLVEKPMATSLVEAQGMRDLARRQNVNLCVVHQNIRNPVVVEAKNLVETGALGDLLDVSVKTCEDRDSPMSQDRDHWCHKLPGGIFFEILPHPTYLIQIFLKEATPSSIHSKKLGNVEWLRKDEVRVALDARNGLGSLTSSCNSLIQADTLDILGTKMALHADIWGRTLILYRPHSKSSFSIGLSNLRLSLQFANVIGRTAVLVLKALGGAARVQAHYAFISEYMDSILYDTRPPTTPEDGIETVRMLETICKQV